ncbi:MAG: hypothetical protein GKR86_13840 [Ilumatobacter sp.]|nr:hypothetical protein [Ilumatobacter sp.]
MVPQFRHQDNAERRLHRQTTEVPEVKPPARENPEEGPVQRVEDTETHGLGAISSLRDDVARRWVGTLLDPQRAADVMEDIGLEAVPESAMRASLKPDSGLGVTVLAISVNDARYHYALDEIAAQVAAAFFVEELRRSAIAITHSNNRKEGAA